MKSRHIEIKNVKSYNLDGWTREEYSRMLLIDQEDKTKKFPLLDENFYDSFRMIFNVSECKINSRNNLQLIIRMKNKP